MIEDAGVGMSLEELQYVVKYWTPQMREAAANDVGDRLELLNLALSSKRIAQEANKISREDDPETYWKNQFFIRNTQRQFVVDHYLENLEIPDMTQLARERYVTEPKKYARVPEQRFTSHVLIRCMQPDCQRADKRPVIEKVWAELQAGAAFEAVVEKYSEDPGTKRNQGKFEKWLVKGDPKVDAHYLQAAFEIAEVGGYSGIIESQFGFHIIRLDDLKPEHDLPYEEAKPYIMAMLEKEYKELSAKAFDARFRISDEAYIDGNVMEEVFAPYKTLDTDQ